MTKLCHVMSKDKQLKRFAFMILFLGMVRIMLTFPVTVPVDSINSQMLVLLRDFSFKFLHSTNARTLGRTDNTVYCGSIHSCDNIQSPTDDGNESNSCTNIYIRNVIANGSFIALTGKGIYYWVNRCFGWDIIILYNSFLFLLYISLSSKFLVIQMHIHLAWFIVCHIIDSILDELCYL